MSASPTIITNNTTCKLETCYFNAITSVGGVTAVVHCLGENGSCTGSNSVGNCETVSSHSCAYSWESVLNSRNVSVHVTPFLNVSSDFKQLSWNSWNTSSLCKQWWHITFGRGSFSET